MIHHKSFSPELETWNIVTVEIPRSDNFIDINAWCRELDSDSEFYYRKLFDVIDFDTIIQYYYFSDLNDALLFRLRWCHERHSRL